MCKQNEEEYKKHTFKTLWNIHSQPDAELF